MRVPCVHPDITRAVCRAAIPLLRTATSEIGMKMLFALVMEHPWLTGFAVLFVLGLLAPTLMGAVLIRERQVGVVVKKFGARSLLVLVRVSERYKQPAAYPDDHPLGPRLRSLLRRDGR